MAENWIKEENFAHWHNRAKKLAAEHEKFEKQKKIEVVRIDRKTVKLKYKDK